MKTYQGARALDGALVTVDGRPLDARHDVARLSSTGFEWTYEGPGPNQLALAILCDYLGDGTEALRLAPAFARDTVAMLDNSWQLTGADIDAALERIRRAATAAPPPPR
jgi:Family of unknown function (DUF6166)